VHYGVVTPDKMDSFQQEYPLIDENSYYGILPHLSCFLPRYLTEADITSLFFMAFLMGLNLPLQKGLWTLRQLSPWS
jgi:hypothetical protein